MDVLFTPFINILNDYMFQWSKKLYNTENVKMPILIWEVKKNSWNNCKVENTYENQTNLNCNNVLYNGQNYINQH